ncbi:MAG: NUDIX hydrolase [Candidatus Cryptobacteroides sp.]
MSEEFSQEIVQTNSSLSVDCAVFGYDGSSLKVLLVKRNCTAAGFDADQMKLPGAMIYQNETIEEASQRVLEQSTGLKGIALEQTRIFSDPMRISPEEMEWICKFHGVHTERVVTVGFYALVKLNERIITYTRRRGAKWVDVDSVKQLAMDHADILSDALNRLYEVILHSSAAFDLLPKRFTLTQLQLLLEEVLNITLDKRNFRKKILSNGFLIATGEKEKGVNHKPAEYFEFNYKEYNKTTRKSNENKFGYRSRLLIG